MKGIVMALMAMVFLVTPMALCQSTGTDLENDLGNITASYVEDNMLKAALNVTSFTFSDDFRKDVTIVDGSDINKTISKMKWLEADDLASRKAKIETEMMTELQSGETTTVKRTAYYLGDVKYVDSDGNWTKKPLNESFWQTPSSLIYYTQLLIEKDLDLKRIEKGNDGDNNSTEEYYVLESSSVGENQTNALREEARSALKAYLGSENADYDKLLNYTEISDDSKVLYTVWVNSETHLLEKAARVMKLKISLTGPLAERIDNFRIEIESIDLRRFGKFGEPLEIVLPEEANGV